MVGFLEEYHSEDLKEIVDISAKKLTDKNNFIKIDFHNGDVMHFFKYIAQGMAI